MPQDIANIVAQWTGIPIEKVSSDETERLIKMEEVLHGRVIGQEEAVSAIARAVRRARVGLKNPNRPIASFIFAGPTGGLVLARRRTAQVATSMQGNIFTQDWVSRSIACTPRLSLIKIC